MSSASRGNSRACMWTRPPSRSCSASPGNRFRQAPAASARHCSQAARRHPVSAEPEHARERGAGRAGPRIRRTVADGGIGRTRDIQARAGVHRRHRRPPARRPCLADADGPGGIGGDDARTARSGLFQGLWHAPLAWRWNHRVVEARKRIAQGENIAAVALDLGFADQSHLTRRFRAVVGVPPGQWRDG